MVEDVKSIENATLERMISLLAFEAKREITMLASSKVLISFNSGK